MATTARQAWPDWPLALGDFGCPWRLSNWGSYYAPSVILPVISPFAVYYLSHKPVYVRWSLLLQAKLFFCACLVIVRAAEGLLYFEVSLLHTVTTATAAILVGSLAYVEHRHTIRPSTLLTILLVADFIEEVQRQRTLSLSLEWSWERHLAVSSVALKFIWIALQVMPKAELLVDDALRQKMRDSAAGGLLFGFLSISLKLAFDVCYSPDLFLLSPEHFDIDLQPGLLLSQLKSCWNLQHASALPRPGDLLIACLKAWKSTLFSLFFSRFTLTLLRYGHAFALRFIIQTVGRQFDGEIGLAQPMIAFGVASSLFVSTMIVQEHFSRLMVGYSARLRGGLIALQLDKLQRLTEADAKNAASVTLIRSDVEHIVASMQKFLMIPISLVEVGLGISLLSWFIGSPASMVCLPILLSALAGYLISRRMVKRLATWTECTNARVASTSRTLRHLTAIKMLGLGPTMSHFLQRLRMTEMASSNAYYRLEAFLSIFSILSDLGVPAATIGTALYHGFFSTGISSDKVFPLLSMVIPIQSSFPSILNSFSTMMSLTPCFTRIQAFLCLPEARDCRIEAPSTLFIGSGTSSTDAICFNHAEISPSTRKEPILRAANFRLARGSVTGLVGPQGTGKSTLLRSILGECEVVAGSVHVNGNEIGYCGEEAWLQDATIRANIVGVFPFDLDRYKAVLAGCFLDEDLERLPGGDEYIVGTHGCNLSDGQRQRIGIARAAYAQMDITLLDDVFRSLDIETAICILHQLCGRNSILRRAGCTVIVVTSLPQCMEVVDQLLILDGFGHVALDTTIRSSPRHQRVRNALTKLNRDNNALLFLEKREQKILYRYLQAHGAPGRGRPVARTPSVSEWQLIKFALAPVGRMFAALHGLLVLMLSFAELLPDIWLKFWIESWPTDLSLYSSYASFSAVTSIVAFAAYSAVHTLMSPQISVGLHGVLVETLSRSTLAFFGVANLERLSQLFGEDTVTIARVLPRHMLRIVYAGLAGFFMTGMILSANRYAAFALPGLLMLLFCALRSYCVAWRDTHRLEAKQKAALSAFFEETAAGLTHIRSFSQLTASRETATQIMTAGQISFYMASMMAVRLRFYMDALVAAIAVLLLLLSLFIKGTSSESSLGLAYHTVIGLPRVLSATVIAVAGFDTTLECVRRVFEFEQDTPLEKAEGQSLKLPQEWPQNGAIELQDVFAYHSPNVDTSPALVDISLSVGPGEHLGIAGRSFSGKSSLLLAMLGFIRYEGSIHVDGVDLLSIPPEVLRSRLITIPQDPVIFDGTVRTNLLPYNMGESNGPMALESTRDPNDLELEQLLKRLHLWVPLVPKGGLDAVVDNVGYSKHETQLLCIARAILRQRATGRKVILIDDATRGFNIIKERIANDVMRDCFRDCTVLRISARQSGLEGVDYAIRLNRGVVVDPSEVDDIPDSDSEAEDDA